MFPTRSSNALLLQSNQMPRHTDVGRVFESFEGLQRKFNWLLTGDEQFFAYGRPTWIGGDQFADLVAERMPVYDWAVLSAFEPGTEVNLAPDRFPYADGNRHLWLPYPAPQHPQAVFEIVCFDASLTMLVSRDPAITARFRAFFSDAIDLDQYIDNQLRPILRSWQNAATAVPVGREITALVTQVGQTTAQVELVSGIWATVAVKQMRATGFGPSHWFPLDQYLIPGQKMRVRIVAMNPEEQRVEVEFVRMEL